MKLLARYRVGLCLSFVLILFPVKGTLGEDCSAAYSEFASSEETGAVYRAMTHTTRSLACQFSVNDLLKTYGKDGYFAPPRDLISISRDGGPEYSASVVSNYVEACFTRFELLEHGRFGRFVDELRKRFVFIQSNIADFPTCNGIILGNEILTARHCLDSLYGFQESMIDEVIFHGDSFCGTATPLRVEDYHFFRIVKMEGGQLKREYFDVDLTKGLHPALYSASEALRCEAISSHAEEKRRRVLDSDWVLLKLVNPPSGLIDNGLAISDARSVDFDTAFLSLNSFVLADGVFKSTMENGRSMPLDTDRVLFDALSFETELDCRIYVKSGRLFVHGCQTQWDSSGAPLIEWGVFYPSDESEKRAVAWRVLGINTGPTTQYELCDSNGLIGSLQTGDGYIRNGGVIVPEDFLPGPAFRRVE